MEAKVVHEGAFVENISLPDNYYLKCVSDTPLIQTIELLPCRLIQYIQHLLIKLKHTNFIPIAFKLYNYVQHE